MKKVTTKVWNGFWFFVLVEILAVTFTSGNSIMDIINMERVEKLLAERRENASMELEQERRLILQNSVDGDDSFLNNDNDEDEGNLDGDPAEVSGLHHELPKISGHKKPVNQKGWHRFNDRTYSLHSSDSKGHRIRPNFTGIPDVSSLLADFTTVRVDKLLKSDRNSQLVTKKEYLKKDWCKTEPILQKIREDGCLTRTILNRFCYGQCNSFYIPKNPPRRRRNRKKQQQQQQQGNEDESEDNFVFKSCGFCKPRRSSYIFVTLKCPALVPPFRKKRVQRIKQCKCLSENFN